MNGNGVFPAFFNGFTFRSLRMESGTPLGKTKIGRSHPPPSPTEAAAFLRPHGENGKKDNESHPPPPPEGMIRPEGSFRPPA